MKTKNQLVSILFLMLSFMFTACAQTTKKQENTKKKITMENTIKKTLINWYKNITYDFTFLKFKNRKKRQTPYSSY